MHTIHENYPWYKYCNQHFPRLQPYKIYNPDYPGKAFIINNVAKQMPGSRNDTAALKRLYETLRFEVEHYEDCDDVVGEMVANQSIN